MNISDLEKVAPYLWEVPRRGAMRVPARIYASERMMRSILQDNAPEQVVNVAQLPGIIKASFAMPDIHWGYGFPIGGVAAFDMDEGIVSPGGVGYDINCGVRLMACGLDAGAMKPVISEILNQLFARVPSGVGSEGAISMKPSDLEDVATDGAQWAVSRGYGTDADMENIEENGCMQDAEPDKVSDRAWQRGRTQLGTLGSGNHFIEVGYVAEVYDEAAAQIMGLGLNKVTLSVHTGSRGFGHQVCDDYLSVMDRAARKYGIQLPDRQLSCAPLRSDEGQSYLQAMRCAVNYAFANRQVIAHNVRQAFAEVFGRSDPDSQLRTVYEVAHNIAKIEMHEVEGSPKQLCVHRKGATRAFGPGSEHIPAAYRGIGQPVLIPGDMGRCSYVLAGTAKAMQDTFGSACHGAGRVMSRNQATKSARGRNIAAELAEKGIVVRAKGRGTLAEEMPEAYKDVSEVVDACAMAGIARKVAQIKPLGCIKG